MVERKWKKVFVSLVLISLITLCATSMSAATQQKEKKDIEKPAEIESPTEPPKIKEYTYTLSPDKVDTPGEYTRLEIESFLCACVPGYIRAEDLNKVPLTGKYFVKPKKMVEHQKKMTGKYEINKWFEDQVLVTSRGNLNILDIDTIKEFYKKINQLIGKKKFVYKAGLKAANIVIELAPPDESLRIHQYVGETSILHDNLRVRLTTHDQTMKLQIETYKLGSGKLINEARHIKLTPEEKEFRKDNRLVKVYMKNILDPHVRYFALVHELLHSIGFTGHSPYYKSHLFPLPVRAFSNLLPTYRKDTPILAKLAERMVEILYRPEILPGMTVEEARTVLTHLKKIEHTPKTEIISHLLEKKNQLENQQQTMMQKEETNYAQKMKLYLELDKLVTKEQSYLEELKEIRSDYGLEATVVQEVRDTTSMVAKLVRIRRELIIAESQKKKLTETINSPNNRKDTRKVRRDLKRLHEEIVVLNDLLEAAQKVTAMEQNILAAISSTAQKQTETTLRRILRQLYTIDNELDNLRELVSGPIAQ